MNNENIKHVVISATLFKLLKVSQNINKTGLSCVINLLFKLIIV